jgi:hypothetical protein
VYVFEVEERLSFAAYWADRRFRKKRATWPATSWLERCGDNIYAPDGGAGFVQQPSLHYDHANGRERPRMKARDLAGGAVLAGRRFVYFGGAGPKLPRRLEFLRVGRSHRCRFDDAQVAAVRVWFDGLEQGVRGRPTLWHEGDESWRAGCGSC